MTAGNEKAPHGIYNLQGELEYIEKQSVRLLKRYGGGIPSPADNEGIDAYYELGQRCDEVLRDTRINSPAYMDTPDFVATIGKLKQVCLGVKNQNVEITASILGQ